jgi:hypothetical protein
MKLLAPFGYKLQEEIDTDNERDVLELMLNLSDDPGWLRHVSLDTHENRLKVLKQNGFQIEGEE